MSDIVDPLDILARTVWGEARNLGVAGMRAVASVILNRVSEPRWWGSDIVTVCQKPWQFSCWNEGDPNRGKLLTVDATNAAFKDALGVADEAVRGLLEDTTGGADSYYDTSIAPPYWTEGARLTAQVGTLRFYRTE